MKAGDKVRIVKRLESNDTGTVPGWNEKDGNVGEEGVIEYINSSSMAKVKRDNYYLGVFCIREELTLVEPYYELY